MTVPRCGRLGKRADAVLTFLLPQPPVFFSSDSLSSWFLGILEPTMERERREEVKFPLKTTHITLKSPVGECDCSIFFHGYVHELQSSLCFRVMLLLRIKSMNDKGDVPRQQGKGQNEYKRVIILYDIFIIIILWDKVAGILPFSCLMFNLAMKVFFKIIFKRVWRGAGGKESILSWN